MKYMRQVFGTVFILMALVGLWVSPLTAQDDELKPGLAMATKKISVLAEAEVGSGKLATLEIGELVNVLEVDGGWARLEYGDIVGWARPTTLINVNGPTPSARGYHAMTYDVESDRVILFGGLTTGSNVNDTWAYDISTNTWTKMAPAQSPTLGEGPLAYDHQSDRVIRFLLPIMGNRPTGEPSETWAYDLNTDTWTNLEPSTAPPPLAGARMVYDVESDRMILFGGIDVSNKGWYANETWAYDYDTNTWTQMDPEVRPPGVNYHPMAYDASADRIILIGSDAYEKTDDTWVYDYNTDTWEKRETTDSPKHRDYSWMVYADAIGQVILFGEGKPSLKNDTWAYDYDTNTWTPLEPDTSPSERGWHAMAYSTAADQVVLFGGGRSPGATTLETWLYDPETNTWTQVGP
jgi:N-acetylneuraminic acid mutarotase